MPAVNLAFVWHQHQPYYPDRIGGENPMPWVRLHGTKDYWGMAWHIKEVPEFRCTINLVPSLLEQLIAYTDGGASDRHLDVSRTPADGLSEADTRFLLDQFFIGTRVECFLWVPSYAKWLETADQRTAYQELKTQLKFLQWQDPKRRGKAWILKTPQHLSAPEALPTIDELTDPVAWLLRMGLPLLGANAPELPPSS